MTSHSTIKKFHQFVQIQTGPKNTAMIDLLKGNVYQVPKEIIEKFVVGDNQSISQFVEAATQEELIIELEPGDWIPRIPPLPEENAIEDTVFEIHVEAGANLEVILAQVAQLKGYKLRKINYYGEFPPTLQTHMSTLPITQREKTFQECLRNTCIDENFKHIGQSFYSFTQKYNSCLGLNIAFTADGKIRPCIFSEIILGDIQQDSLAQLMPRIKELWRMTKAKVETCKDCELKYVCFDCREIAHRTGHTLDAPNPNCTYNPYQGTWAKNG